MPNQKTKQEKRKEILRKKIIKQTKGGTLSGQILRMQIAKNYKRKK